MRKFKNEKDFQNWAEKELKTLPRSWWIRPITGSRRGIPDVIGCYEGTFIGIEWKKPDAKKKAHETLQGYNLEKIEGAGGLTFNRVTYKNWHGVWEQIRSLSEEKKFTEQ